MLKIKVKIVKCVPIVLYFILIYLGMSSMIGPLTGEGDNHQK